MEKITKVSYRFHEDDRINFKLWLVQNGLTLDKFAEKVGISTSLLGMIITGKRVVTGKVMAKFRLAGFDFDKGE